MSSNAKPKKAPAIEESQILDEAVAEQADAVEMAHLAHADDGEVNEAIPQAGYFGFSARELGILGVTLVLILAAIFGPGFTSGIESALVTGGALIASILLVVRRVSAEQPPTLGSLSIDQFASVVFVVSLIAWIQLIVARLIAGDPLSFGYWIGLIAAAAGVVLTVGAPHIPGLRDDFIGRPDALANAIAAPARPIIAVPRPVIDPADEEILTGDEALEELEEDFDDAPPAPPSKD